MTEAMSKDETRKNRVEEGLHELRMALTPYVEGRMQKHYGDEWQQHTPPKQPGERGSLMEVHNLLKTILDNWTDVFRDDLGKMRTYVSMCMEARLSTSHFDGAMGVREALRYLDSIWEITAALSAGFQSQRLKDLYAEQLAEGAAASQAPDGRIEDAGEAREAAPPPGEDEDDDEEEVQVPARDPVHEAPPSHEDWHQHVPPQEHAAPPGRPPRPSERYRDRQYESPRPRQDEARRYDQARRGPGNAERAPDQFRIGERYTGKVVTVTHYGYMLDLGLQRAYLMHNKNLGPRHSAPRYSMGDSVDVEVLSLDHLGRPSLAPVGAAARAAYQRPPHRAAPHGDQRPAAGPGPRIGQVVQGSVRDILPRYAKISLGPGWNGILHISNVSREYVTNIADHVSIGQQVGLKVLDVDHERRRVNLGLKQVE